MGKKGWHRRLAWDQLTLNSTGRFLGPGPHAKPVEILKKESNQSFRLNLSWSPVSVQSNKSLMSALVIFGMQLKERTWGSYSNKTESKPLLGHLTFPSLREGWPALATLSTGQDILLASHLQRPWHSMQLRQSLSCYVKLWRQEREAPCQSDGSPAHIPALQTKKYHHEGVHMDKNGVFTQRPLQTTQQNRKMRKKVVMVLINAKMLSRGHCLMLHWDR